MHFPQLTSNFKHLGRQNINSKLSFQLIWSTDTLVFLYFKAISFFPRQKINQFIKLWNSRGLYCAFYRAIKICTDFPHHECLRPFIFRLRISAYERPQDTHARIYAVHHYDRVATEWKQRKYTLQNVYLKHVVRNRPHLGKKK